jgi:hypothetical protein
MNIKERSLLSVAYHEAGHAVAAFAVRVPVQRATIVPDPGGASPRCYIKDVSAQEIVDYRTGKKDFTADCKPLPWGLPASP